MRPDYKLTYGETTVVFADQTLRDAAFYANLDAYLQSLVLQVEQHLGLGDGSTGSSTVTTKPLVTHVFEAYFELLLEAGVENTIEDKAPRAFYLTPHHQYPTLATLSAPRRLALLELARRHRFALIEDDYDHEFHYEGRPVLPLASADAGGVVIYVGTLSKIFAPGLRAGWVVAPRPVIDALARLRVQVDQQGDLPVEAALAELLEDGVLQRHARKARRIYQARRDFLVEALTRQLPEVLSFRVPTGGLALWTRARGVKVDAWCARAAAP